MTSKKQRKIDVVFLIDATSTMRPLFVYLRNGGMSNALRMITESGFDWRVAVWSYCNPQLGKHWLRRNIFVTNAEDVLVQLNDIAVDGMAFYERPLLDALYSVGNIPSMPRDVENEGAFSYCWRYGKSFHKNFRFVFVLTDGKFYDKFLHHDSLLSLEDVWNCFTINRIWSWIIAPDYVDFSGYDDIMAMDKAFFDPVYIMRNESGTQALLRNIKDIGFEGMDKILFRMQDYEEDIPDPYDVEEELNLDL